ncbi:MAG: Gfo/Idh/MocA family oxidoreductase, partial [Deltaproteobacteria bacterium]
MEPRTAIVATQSRATVAVVGTGYWGKNHVRNFHELGALTHVCDTNGATLKQFAEQYPNVVATDSYDEILANSAVRGVVVATPAITHYEVAEKAIRAGKDVLVEKPLALNIADGEKLTQLASRHGAILMVGHILLYHPAVIKLKEIIDRGELGKIQYIQSNRLSMGKVRSEENILWSFAPHDISTIIYLLGEVPANVYATGYCHIQKDVEDVTISIMDFPSGVGAHIYVSWMNPFKEQRLVVMGDRKMAVFEDSRPDKKLRIFDNNFQWVDRRPVPVKGGEEVVEFEPAEPLKSECQHFLNCVMTRERPRSDGEEGLRTLQVLDRCYRVMKNGSKPTLVATNIVSNEPEVTHTPQHVDNDFLAHETAVVDTPCSIGSKTRIWHFAHVMPEARIGKNCSIGQNVLVGKGVKIGDNCKIQNNVAVYEGVTLEDYVFCGPSMVFTNVYNPRSEIPRMSELRPTLVKQGATIGANATVVCGNTIGRYAFIGAGAVVCNDVADYALMMGNPARRAGWMCRCGVRLPKSYKGESVLQCSSCGEQYAMTAEDRIA